MVILSFVATCSIGRYAAKRKLRMNMRTMGILGKLTAQRGLVCLARQLARPTASKRLVVPHRTRYLPLFTSAEKTPVFQTSIMSFSTIERGAPNTLEYRIFYKNAAGNVISPFHDIPLQAQQGSGQKVFNMVVEVPRWTNAKMEISTGEKLNPIKQDVKKGKLRFVNNCFPHHGYIWNYGAIPQTWEDPAHTDEHTGQKGDNDPLDVCEIGFKVHKRGDVIQVKVLGIMALIDEGETDWKVIAIDVTDPLASQMNDIEDVEKHMPGFLRATNEWFRIYKIPTGKPENQFAFNGEAKNREFAEQIIQQTHEQWQALVGKTVDNGGTACENTSVHGSPFQFSQEDAKIIVDNSPAPGQAAPIEDEVNKWFYVKL